MYLQGVTFSKPSSVSSRCGWRRRARSGSSVCNGLLQPSSALRRFGRSVSCGSTFAHPGDASLLWSSGAPVRLLSWALFCITTERQSGVRRFKDRVTLSGPKGQQERARRGCERGFLLLAGEAKIGSIFRQACKEPCVGYSCKAAWVAIWVQVFLSAIYF